MSDDALPHVIGAVVTYVYERVGEKRRPTLVGCICDSVVTTYTYPGTENRRPRPSAASNEENRADGTPSDE